MPDLSLKFILRRELYHALGALAVGLIMRFLHLPILFLLLAFGIVVAWELTNEHPDWRWWLKSLLDAVVWCGVMYLCVIL
jgi:phosphoglycerol transferase MdoB-like AlkP superfamily enzyme